MVLPEGSGSANTYKSDKVLPHGDATNRSIGDNSNHWYQLHTNAITDSNTGTVVITNNLAYVGSTLESGTTFSSALGQNSTIGTGLVGALTSGVETNVSSNYGTALGNQSSVVGIGGFASGYQTVASDYSIATGYQTYAGFTAYFNFDGAEYELFDGVNTVGLVGDYVSLFLSGNKIVIFDSDNGGYYPDIIISTDAILDVGDRPYTVFTISGSLPSMNITHGYVINLNYPNTNAYAYSEGKGTVSNTNSHAEGNQTLASGLYSHAEGNQNLALGLYSHAEGNQTSASGLYSHSEGFNNKSSGVTSHAEGYNNVAYSDYAHIGGRNSISSDISLGSFVHGLSNKSFQTFAFSEGILTFLNGTFLRFTTTSVGGNYWLKLSGLTGNLYLLNDKTSNLSTVSFIYFYYQTNLYYGYVINKSYDLDSNTTTVTLKSSYSTTIPQSNLTSDFDNSYVYYNQAGSHVEGLGTISDGSATHAEGFLTTTNGDASHAEGGNTQTTANAVYGHAEGYLTTVDALASHAEGYQTKAGINIQSYFVSFASGVFTFQRAIAIYLSLYNNIYFTSSGTNYSGLIISIVGAGSNFDITVNTTFTSGSIDTVWLGNYSHAEGNTTFSSGDSSHVEGVNNYSTGVGSHTGGANSFAIASGAFAHGSGIISSQMFSFAEGINTVTNDNRASTFTTTVFSGNYWNLVSTSSSSTIGQLYTSGNQSGSFTTPAFIYFFYNSVMYYGYVADAVYDNDNDITAITLQTTGQIYISLPTSSLTVDFDNSLFYNTIVAAHAEGLYSQSTGSAAHSEGFLTNATGTSSHTEGGNTQTTSNGIYAHAEGYSTQVDAFAAHAEGQFTNATGQASHAEGQGYDSTHNITASGIGSHAQGSITVRAKNITASGEGSFAGGATIGFGDITSTGVASFAHGIAVNAGADGAVALGCLTNASANYGTAIGYQTSAIGIGGFSSGYQTVASDYSAAMNYQTYAGFTPYLSGQELLFDHLTGIVTLLTDLTSIFLSGNSVVIFDSQNIVYYSTLTLTGDSAYDSMNDITTFTVTGELPSSDIIFGYIINSSKPNANAYAYSEGKGTVSNMNSHAEGNQTLALGTYSHAEGINTQTSGTGSHAEGYTTSASGSNSHAEGENTRATGKASHVGGQNSASSGLGSFAHGSGVQAGQLFSFAEGVNSSAIADSYISFTTTSLDGNYWLYGTTIKGSLYVVDDQTSYFSNVSFIYFYYQTVMYYGYIVNSSYDGGTNTTTINLQTKITAGYISLPASNITSDLDYSTVYYNKVGAHVEGLYSVVRGTGAHTEGFLNTAIGDASHAEGGNTQTTSNGIYAHAEGYSTQVDAFAAHAEGQSTNATGQGSHAEGQFTNATGQASHAEGHGNDSTYNITASGIGSHAQGSVTNSYTNITASGEGSFAGGTTGELGDITSSGTASFAHGISVNANADGAVAFGNITSVTSNYGTAIGDQTSVIGIGGFASGYRTVASDYSSATGYQTYAGFAPYFSPSGIDLFDGTNITLSGDQTANISSGDSIIVFDVQGNNYYPGILVNSTPSYDSVNTAFVVLGSLPGTINSGYIIDLSKPATNTYSHTEGKGTVAKINAHAEGNMTLANGLYSHAEGYLTQAIGDHSHVEGNQTQAIGDYSHAEGQYTYATGQAAHVQGIGYDIDHNITASGKGSHAQGSVPGLSGSITASAEGSFAGGIASTGNVTSSGLGSLAHGISVNATADGAVALGNLTNASGSQSQAQGYKTKAGGAQSAVFGYNNYAYGDNSTILGSKNMSGSFVGLTATSGNYLDTSAGITFASSVTLATSDVIAVYNITNDAVEEYTINTGATGTTFAVTPSPPANASSNISFNVINISGTYQPTNAFSVGSYNISSGVNSSTLGRYNSVIALSSSFNIAAPAVVTSTYTVSSFTPGSPGVLTLDTGITHIPPYNNKLMIFATTTNLYISTNNTMPNTGPIQLNDVTSVSGTVYSSYFWCPFYSLNLFVYGFPYYIYYSSNLSSVLCVIGDNTTSFVPNTYLSYVVSSTTYYGTVNASYSDGSYTFIVLNLDGSARPTSSYVSSATNIPVIIYSGSNSTAIGYNNYVSGARSTAIGANNTISGNDTFVGGPNVISTYNNNFIWGDGSATVNDTVSNQTIFYTKNGFNVYTNNSSGAIVASTSSTTGGVLTVSGGTTSGSSTITAGAAGSGTGTVVLTGASSATAGGLITVNAGTSVGGNVKIVGSNASTGIATLLIGANGTTVGDIKINSGGTGQPNINFEYATSSATTITSNTSGDIVLSPPSSHGLTFTNTSPYIYGSVTGTASLTIGATSATTTAGSITIKGGNALSNPTTSNTVTITGGGTSGGAVTIQGGTANAGAINIVNIQPGGTGTLGITNIYSNTIIGANSITGASAIATPATYNAPAGPTYTTTSGGYNSSTGVLTLTATIGSAVTNQIVIFSDTTGNDYISVSNSLTSGTATIAITDANRPTSSLTLNTTVYIIGGGYNGQYYLYYSASLTGVLITNALNAAILSPGTYISFYTSSPTYNAVVISSYQNASLTASIIKTSGPTPLSTSNASGSSLTITYYSGSQYSLSVGTANTNTKNNTLTSGIGTRASANGSIALGMSTGFLTNGAITASGNGAFASGYATGAGQITSSGLGSFALGYGDTTANIISSGQGSFALGTNVNASGNYSFALGSGATSSAANNFTWSDGTSVTNSTANTFLVSSSATTSSAIQFISSNSSGGIALSTAGSGTITTSTGTVNILNSAPSTVGGLLYMSGATAGVSTTDPIGAQLYMNGGSSSSTDIISGALLTVGGIAGTNSGTYNGGTINVLGASGTNTEGTNNGGNIVIGAGTGTGSKKGGEMTVTGISANGGSASLTVGTAAGTSAGDIVITSGGSSDPIIQMIASSSATSNSTLQLAATAYNTIGSFQFTNDGNTNYLQVIPGYMGTTQTTNFTTYDINSNTTQGTHYFNENVQIVNNLLIGQSNNVSTSLSATSASFTALATGSGSSYTASSYIYNTINVTSSIFTVSAAPSTSIQSNVLIIYADSNFNVYISNTNTISGSNPNITLNDATRPQINISVSGNVYFPTAVTGRTYQYYIPYGPNAAGIINAVLITTGNNTSSLYPGAIISFIINSVTYTASIIASYADSTNTASIINSVSSKQLPSSAQLNTGVGAISSITLYNPTPYVSLTNGTNNSISSNNSTALGIKLNSSAYGSLTQGYNTVANGYYSSAFGNTTYAGIQFVQLNSTGTTGAGTYFTFSSSTLYLYALNANSIVVGNNLYFLYNGITYSGLINTVTLTSAYYYTVSITGSFSTISGNLTSAFTSVWIGQYSYSTGLSTYALGDGSFSGGYASAGFVGATNIGSFVYGYNTNVSGSVQANGVGSSVLASNTSSGSIQASGAGARIIGANTSSGSMLASAQGAIIAGLNSSSANMSVTTAGGIILGYSVNSASMTVSTGQGPICIGNVSGNSLMTSSGNGSVVIGHGSNNGSLTASAAGAVVLGNANGANGAGTCLMNATGQGAIVLGSADGNVGGSGIQATGIGSIAGGNSTGTTSTTNTGIVSAGRGSIALGYSSTTAANGIYAASNGAFAMGYVTGSGSIQAQTGLGAFAMGYATTSSSVSSTGQGSFAMGTNVSASGNGAFALGSGATSSATNNFTWSDGTSITNSTANTFLVTSAATATSAIKLISSNASGGINFVTASASQINSATGTVNISNNAPTTVGGLLYMAGATVGVSTSVPIGAQLYMSGGASASTSATISGALLTVGSVAGTSTGTYGGGTITVQGASGTAAGTNNGGSIVIGAGSGTGTNKGASMTVTGISASNGTATLTVGTSGGASNGDVVITSGGNSNPIIKMIAPSTASSNATLQLSAAPYGSIGSFQFTNDGNTNYLQIIPGYKGTSSTSAYVTYDINGSTAGTHYFNDNVLIANSLSMNASTASGTNSSALGNATTATSLGSFATGGSTYAGAIYSSTFGLSNVSGRSFTSMPNTSNNYFDTAGNGIGISSNAIFLSSPLSGADTTKYINTGVTIYFTSSGVNYTATVSQTQYSTLYSSSLTTIALSNISPSIAGNITTQLTNVCIGPYSYAAGLSSVALGQGSLAVGNACNAWGDYSTAHGTSNSTSIISNISALTSYPAPTTFSSYNSTTKVLTYAASPGFSTFTNKLVFFGDSTSAPSSLYMSVVNTYTSGGTTITITDTTASGTPLPSSNLASAGYVYFPGGTGVSSVPSYYGIGGSSRQAIIVTGNMTGYFTVGKTFYAYSYSGTDLSVQCTVVQSAYSSIDNMTGILVTGAAGIFPASNVGTSPDANSLYSAMSSTNKIFIVLNANSFVGGNNSFSIGSSSFAYGSQCVSIGTCSVALGQNSNAAAANNFIWCDGTAAATNSTANSFVVYASGGTIFSAPSATVTISSSTASSSSSTGALVVSGGLGVGGVTNLGNNLRVNANTTLGVASSGTLSAAGNGTCVSGYTTGGSITTSGNGSFACGYTNASSGIVTATGNGSFAFGSTSNIGGSSGIVQSTGEGSFATGFATVTSIRATNKGSFAGGYSTSGDILASGGGSFAFGAGNSTGGITASGVSCFALGTGALNSGDNSFVFSDGTATVSTSSIRTFKVLASGGYAFYTNSAQSLGVSLASNATSWGAISLRSTKDVVDANINHEKNIELLDTVPVEKWKYKNADIVYLGVYIDEFYPAYGLGDGMTICDRDYEGVALSCLKGLYTKHKRLQTQCDDQKTTIDSQTTQISTMQSTIDSQTTQISTMQSTIDSQTTQIDSLQSSLIDVLARLAALEARLN
jgi:hypothetical protein